MQQNMQKIKELIKGNKIAFFISISVLLFGLILTVANLQKVLETRQRASEIGNCPAAETDVILIFDRSGSMSSSTSSKSTVRKINAAKTAAKLFVDRFASNSAGRIALVSYNEKATLNVSLSNNKTSIITAIDSLSASGNTCIQCAIDTANKEFTTNGRSSAKKVIVLLTDGIANVVNLTQGNIISNSNTPSPTPSSMDLKMNSYEKAAYNSAINAYNTNKVTTYTIGLGIDVHGDFLKKVATDTGGKYYFSPTETELNAIYTEISEISQKGSVSGKVFEDINKNGNFDIGENILTGWGVILKNSEGNEVTRSTTGSEGNSGFIITGICDGVYTLSLIPLEGFSITFPAKPYQYPITIVNGSVFKDKDFGVVRETITPTIIPPSATVTPPLISITPPSACPPSKPDIMLMIDTSVSMKDFAVNGDQTTKLQAAKDAAKLFIDKFSTVPDARIGLTTYSGDMASARVITLTNDFSGLKSVIDDLQITSENDSTCIECALIKANQEITDHGRSGTKRVFVMLTDGKANAVSDEPSTQGTNPVVTLAYTQGTLPNGTEEAEKAALSAATKAYNQNYASTYSIGLGNQVNSYFLMQLASGTGGKYYYTASSENLDNIYSTISEIATNGSITGKVFEDLNENGIIDENEQKLAGWTVVLKDTNNNLIKTYKTTVEEGFTLTDICDGTYYLSIILEEGWKQTVPVNPDYYKIIISNGNVSKDKNFGVNKKPVTITPTVPITDGPGIILDYTVFLHSIGNSGDNRNPNEYSLSNKNPKHPIRNVIVELFNTQEQILATKEGQMTYNSASASGNFTGSVNFGNAVPSGQYIVKIKTLQFLRNSFTGIQTLTAGKTHTMPVISLVAGDSVEDNRLDILDYNMLYGCYSTDLFPTPRSCDDTKKVLADLNDDGNVNQYDINLFVRELSVQQGK